jgi:uncharacterized membrane protein YeaQ/YmgE (transglycosylase-associated protein family)
MSVLGWIVVGFIAGGLAGMATKTEKQGCLSTIVVGILGALLGGALYRLATGDETDVFDEFDLWSVFVAFVGAAGLLLILQALGVRGRRR